MFKRTWPFIISAGIVLIMVGYFFYTSSQSPTLNWGLNYQHNSRSPYGNELLYKMMKSLYSEKEFATMEEPLANHSDFMNDRSNKSIYFFCGNGFYPDRSTIAALKKFVNDGNQVFIASGSVSQYFIDSLLHPEKELKGVFQNSLASVECMTYWPGFLHPDLKNNKRFGIRYKFMKSSFPLPVGYVSQNFEDNLSFSGKEIDYYKIGYFEGAGKSRFTNYVKIKAGKGWLHLYTTPLVLTNYYLRNQEVFNYAQKIFLHLEPGDIYWHVNKYDDATIENAEHETGQNPFGVLLSVNSFRYAWYSFCVAIILFCLLSSKRKQRPIPVIEKNNNTSIEFAETISKLYLADGRHKNIAMQKYRYFFNFVKNRYAINIRNNDTEDKKRLSYLSKLPMEHIEKIMLNYRVLESLPDTKTDELYESVRLINEFYKSGG